MPTMPKDMTADSLTSGSFQPHTEPCQVRDISFIPWILKGQKIKVVAEK